MAVILPSAYRDGTTSVEQGSDTVTGQGTLFRLSVLPGDWYSTDDGFFIMISEVVSDTELKLIAPYPGVSITTQKYSIMLQSDIARMQETTRQLLETLRNGNLVAFAGLVGSVDKIPMFSGPGAMTLVDRYELVRSFRYDVIIPNMSGLSAYDNSAAGFVVLVEDADGSGRSAFLIKRSADSGDWTDPIYNTGEKGDTGERGPYTTLTVGPTTTLPAGSSATVTPVVVDSETVRLDFGLPKGADGIGDINGPSSSVDNGIVGFSGTTGKLIKQLTVEQALQSLGPVFGGNAPTPSTAGVGLTDGDFNTIVFPGVYTIAGTWVNGAPVVAATHTGILEVKSRSLGGLIIQTYRNSSGDVLTRIGSGSPIVWGGWYTSETLISPFAITLLDDTTGSAMFTTMGATSGTGWTKLPNGRLFQWGTSIVTVDSGGNSGVFFPTSFSSGTSYNVVAWSGDSGVLGGTITLTQLRSSPWPQASGFAVSARNSSTGAAHTGGLRVDWIAIGVAP